MTDQDTYLNRLRTIFGAVPDLDEKGRALADLIDGRIRLMLAEYGVVKPAMEQAINQQFSAFDDQEF